VVVLNQRRWQSLGGQHGKGADGLFDKASFHMLWPRDPLDGGQGDSPWSIGWSCEWAWVVLLTVPTAAHESIENLETVMFGIVACQAMVGMAFSLLQLYSPAADCMTEWLQVSELILPKASTYVWAGRREDECLILV